MIDIDAPPVLPALTARVAELEKHADMCTGCTRCEAMPVFAVLAMLLRRHEGDHLCGPPGLWALHGPQRPAGPNCSPLERAAEMLGVPLPGQRGAP